MDLALSLVFAYLFISFAEMSAHRWVMHESVSGLDSVFKQHTLHHAVYRKGVFSKSLARPEAVFVNQVICAESSITFCLPAAILGYFVSPTFSIVLILMSILHFFAYNQIHAAMHLGKKVGWLPDFVWRSMLKHHFIHHCQPEKNFCVVALGADYLFGTVGRLKPQDLHEWKKIRRQKGSLSVEDKQNLWEANFCFFPALVKRLKQLSTCGYVPKTPSPTDVRIGKAICKVIAFLFIGKVEVRGSLPEYPVLVCANHGSWKDLFLFPLLTDKPVRIMGHSCVIGFAGGLFAPILTKYLGCVPTLTAKAVDSASSLLDKGETVCVAPEGFAWLDGAVRPFKTGAVRIHRQSGKQIVPVYIRFGRYPGKWILCFPPVVQYIISILMLIYRSGAVIQIGNPIRSLVVEDVREASDLLRFKVLMLDPKS